MPRTRSESKRICLDPPEWVDTIDATMKSVADRLDTIGTSIQSVHERLDKVSQTLGDYDKRLASLETLCGHRTEKVSPAEIQKLQATSNTILKLVTKENSHAIWSTIVIDGRSQNQPITVDVYSKTERITRMSLVRLERDAVIGWDGEEIRLTPYSNVHIQHLPYHAYRVTSSRLDGIILCMYDLVRLLS